MIIIRLKIKSIKSLTLYISTFQSIKLFNKLMIYKELHCKLYHNQKLSQQRPRSVREGVRLFQYPKIFIGTKKEHGKYPHPFKKLTIFTQFTCNKVVISKSYLITGNRVILIVTEFNCPDTGWECVFKCISFQYTTCTIQPT